MSESWRNLGDMTPGVIVVGAGGHVGGGIVRGLARQGRTVLAASRRPSVPLADGGPGPGHVRPVRYAHVAELGDAVRAVCERDGIPPPGAAVAAIGGWQLGARLLDEPDLDGWRATLDSHLTAHLGAIRALAPLLRAGTASHPAYVVLNGAARGEPMAGSGAVNVTGAGLAMLIQVLRLEEPGVTPGRESVATADRRRPLRFHELVIDHAVVGDDRNVTPEREITLAAVVHGVATVLDDPAAPAVVHA